MRQTKNILIAPLNWGLGHATRCIPMIKKYQAEGHRLIIASDGVALQLLQKEFPDAIFETLPAYNITYARKSWLNSWHLLRQLPHILKTIRQERQLTESLVDKYQIDTLISDNRFGVYSKKVFSVYITHQLKVLSGLTTFLTTWLHQKIYQKYDEIRVPDVAGTPNYSGKLGHLSVQNQKIKYIGIQSRMKPEKLTKKYDVLAVLSGPEPQRSLLEQKLLEVFNKLSLKTALVQGLVTGTPDVKNKNGTDVYNYLTSNDLERLLNQSEIIIARSGYTSIMDLTVLQKKVIWIPTPGQPEQVYLAQYLSQNPHYKFVDQSQIHFLEILIPKLRN